MGCSVRRGSLLLPGDGAWGRCGGTSTAQREGGNPVSHLSVRPPLVYQLQSFLRSVRTLRPRLAFQGLTKLFMLTKRRPCFRSECPATRYSTPDE